MKLLPEVLKVPKNSCPESQAQAGVTTVVLSVGVDCNGVPTVSVRESSGIEACDGVAVDAVSRAKFRPARDLDGERITMTVRYEYLFVTRD